MLSLATVRIKKQIQQRFIWNEFMATSINAMRYADLYGITMEEVIAKIKRGELKGHSRFLSWYVDDVDSETPDQKNPNPDETISSVTTPFNWP